MKRIIMVTNLLAILFAAQGAVAQELSYTAAVPGTCPWDVTGPGLVLDGQVDYDPALKWYESDVYACYTVHENGLHPEYANYFPKCDINQDGVVDMDEVWEVYYRIGACDEKEVYGNQHLAVILVNYQGIPPYATPEQIHHAMFEHEYSVARFIDEASYGHVSITGDVVGWYTPSEPLGEAQCGPYRGDALALAANDLELSDYDGFVVVVMDGAKAGCAKGFGSFGTVNSGVPGESVHAYFSNIRAHFKVNDPFPPNRVTNPTVGHELIHNFGFPQHAAAYDCGTEVITSDGAGCTLWGVTDAFDVMGQTTQGTHPNAPLKEDLGWLDPRDIVTVTQSGMYSLSAYELPGPGPKVLKIPLPVPIQVPTFNSPYTHLPAGTTLVLDYLYVEYRGLTGIDERDPSERSVTMADDSVFEIGDIHGALIHGVDSTVGNYNYQLLLDATPESIVNSKGGVWEDFNDAQLPLGEAFIESLNNIRIETVQVNEGQDITVSVTIP